MTHRLHDGVLRNEHSAILPCRSCGGSMRFDIRQQEMKCALCGRSSEIEARPDTDGRLLATQEFVRPAPVWTSRGAKPANPVGEQSSPVPAPVPARGKVDKEFVCRNCGAPQAFVQSRTSINCTFCATPTQRADVHDTETSEIDGVLPFAIDEDAVTQAVGQWASRQRFAPDSFRSDLEVISARSVYQAHFSFGISCTTRYTGRRGDKVREIGNDKSIQWSSVGGSLPITFDNVMVAGNDGIDHTILEELGPWPASSTQGFDRRLIAGHASHTFDRGPKECLEDARRLIDSDIEQIVESQIGGDYQKVTNRSTIIERVELRRLLLPVWLVVARHDGTDFEIGVNGATGTVHGERPFSRINIALNVLLAILVLAALGGAAFFALSQNYQ